MDPNQPVMPLPPSMSRGRLSRILTKQGPRTVEMPEPLDGTYYTDFPPKVGQYFTFFRDTDNQYVQTTRILSLKIEPGRTTFRTNILEPINAQP